jgi:tripartite-type tricarboxylate transporter receptor subunit TctC
MCKKSTIFGLMVLFLFLSTLAFSNVSAQEKFPSRPITFIINFPPGGTIDTSYRPLLEAASRILGQPIIPVNKPGASGTLGPATLKTVKPDGYTLSVGIINLMTVPYMQDVAFDPLQDFTYIIRIHGGQFGIVVRSDSPWKTLKELVEYARQHPNEIKYSTSTPGGPHHFAMEEIALKEGIKWKIVPFPGGAAAITALLGGHVHAASQDTTWVPHVLGGQLRLLTVFGAGRIKKFPDVPTLKELGYTPWDSPLGVIGPAGMDKNVVKILHDAFKEAMNAPVFLKTVDTLDMPLLYMNSEDYDRYIRESYPKYGEAVRMVGLEKKK